MPEFRLVLNEDGASILDQDAQAVNVKTALSLLETLQSAYEKPACVYFLYHESRDLYKIGVTTQSINSRVSQVRYEENARDITLVHTIPCEKASQAIDLEFMLHSMFDNLCAYGEWYRIPLDWMGLFKTLPNFTEAVNRLILAWGKALNKKGYTEFPPKEQAIYQRCRSHLDKWHEGVLARHAKIQELVIQRDALYDAADEIQRQIDKLAET